MANAELLTHKHLATIVELQKLRYVNDFGRSSLSLSRQTIITETMNLTLTLTTTI